MEQACANFVGPVGVMWKTVSEDCNLACDYCYYSTVQGKPEKQIRKIDSQLLEHFIQQYMDFSKGMASFAWQGGEPLLAGLDFFEEVIRLQTKYAPAHARIGNGLQTNGTLINDRWAAFFKQYNFLIGVSIDGPKEIHDKRRIYSHGKGTFEKVMKGITYLRQHEVDFNILTVIHKDNVKRVGDLFNFYQEEGFDFIQFIPCMSFHSQRIDQPGAYEISPKEYGDFLCEAYDYWYNNGDPRISVRIFDNLLNVYCHREAELCSLRKTCGRTLILEQNGDAFPCDFYLHSDWKLGNVGTEPLIDILQHPLWQKFLKMKPTLPEKCQACEWLNLCHGGCPRNRRWSENLQDSDPDYFCESYRQLYAYAHERMVTLANKVRKNLFQQGMTHYYHGKLPGRNDLCACGSGKKYKHCCLSD
ncbi:anaerobic sulfatase maturase [Bacillus sp. J14TS2]|uniref:anaerobic sulfatase maturase n=1 Tax=Bacillus sp. J14TS2 TaxID=2807188 RepID=UPI001B09797C|nr:anaerobic sulfatase maturase [Bacillus sp. J14TS2]GIN73657.1 anaerobic sulfatase maturase [Bacillus sp. J14TS2]